MLNPLLTELNLGRTFYKASTALVYTELSVSLGSSKVLELAATGGSVDSKASASLRKTSSWFAGPQMGSKTTKQIYTHHP